MGQFLSPHNQAILDEIFCEKQVKGKHYVPVGVNELFIKSVQESVTRYGQPMFIVQINKSPQDKSNRAAKVSYKPIKCYHVVGFGGNLGELWFKPFTTTLGYKQLSSLKDKKGKWFKAVVKQKVRYIRNEDGEIKQNISREAVWIEPEIMSVHSTEEQVEVNNYFELFEKEKR